MKIRIKKLLVIGMIICCVISSGCNHKDNIKEHNTEISKKYDLSNVIEITPDELKEEISENAARVRSNVYKVTGTVQVILGEYCELEDDILVYLPSDDLISMKQGDLIAFYGKVSSETDKIIFLDAQKTKVTLTVDDAETQEMIKKLKSENTSDIDEARDYFVKYRECFEEVDEGNFKRELCGKNVETRFLNGSIMTYVFNRDGSCVVNNHEDKSYWEFYEGRILIENNVADFSNRHKSVDDTFIRSYIRKLDNDNYLQYDYQLIDQKYYHWYLWLLSID